MSGKILGHISDSASPDLNLLLDNIDIVRSGLIVHYDMMNTDSYPRAGSFVNDLTGLGHTGSLGLPTSFTFTADGGISFNGTTGQLSYGLTIPEAMTHVIYAKSNVSLWNDYNLLGANRGLNGWSMHTWQSSTDISFGFSGNDGSTASVTITPSVSITTPHMYAITTNGSSSNFAYIDTTEYAMTVTPVFPAPSMVRDGITVSDMHIANDDAPYSTRHGNITVYVHLLYNRQLSKAEMIQNYNALKTYT